MVNNTHPPPPLQQARCLFMRFTAPKITTPLFWQAIVIALFTSGNQIRWNELWKCRTIQHVFVCCLPKLITCGVHNTIKLMVCLIDHPLTQNGPSRLALYYIYRPTDKSFRIPYISGETSITQTTFYLQTILRCKRNINM